MLEEKLADIKRQLIGYATLVEGMIEKSVRGLMHRSREVLHEVIEKDEPRANDYEIEIDEQCATIIAQYQPRARDLRTVLMIFKMSADLERMGDHAVNIAEHGLYLVERPSVKPLIDTPRMAEEVTRMVADAIQSFIDEDALLARAVCERDSVVDALQDQIVRELVTYMLSDAQTIERALHLLAIAKNLERVADLSTNIGEDVIFMVEGRIIKHHQEEKPARDDLGLGSS